MEKENFDIIIHEEWFNLRIFKDLDKLEKLEGLIRKIKGDNNTINLNVKKYKHWWKTTLSKYFKKINFVNSTDFIFSMEDGTMLTDKQDAFSLKYYLDYQNSQEFYLTGPGIKYIEEYYIRDNTCYYDNLINILIMVKDAGKDFEQMLKDNKPYMDYLTILDTGSTDGTLEIIQEFMKKVPGDLFQEKFVDFKYSRNRLLELAGNRCKFNIMLDDTYVIKGDLRKFLQEIRGDQFASSYSLYVRSNDMEYSSNRITKPEKNLKYIYRIHEVIQEENNVNVMIPNNVAYIEDRITNYMNIRTNNRKEWDLKILYEELEQNPDDPRTLYYIAQTYKCLNQLDKTYEYYLKRANHPKEGFVQEKIDAIFEAGRLANFYLNRPWSVAEHLYNWAYSLDTNRPDAIYFLGIGYLLQGNDEKAYYYLKRGFEIGYPVHSQYSLKPTLSFTYLPKHLTFLCYKFKNYSLGLESSKLYLMNNKIDIEYNIQKDWYKIFQKLVEYENCKSKIINIYHKPIIVFCIDGNWNKWTGSDIEKKGLGGSETWAVETASYLADKNYRVILFCNCSNEEIYRGVEYKDLHSYLNFISSNYIKTIFISRFSEWLPASYLAPVENIYLWVHDLSASCAVIPCCDKFKGVYCLSQWHQNYFKNIFPSLNVKYNYYGFTMKQTNENKIKNRFIYSSTANRGLIHVLEMWFSILNIAPSATLEIFCDINLSWANESAPEDLQKIKKYITTMPNIIYRGWCSKAELNKGWSEAEYWLYPCTFKETFCLTALEAANYGTIPITNGLAALSETAAHGIIINGDPAQEDWKNKALAIIKTLIDNESIRNNIINKGKAFASNLTWEKQTAIIANEL